MLHIITAQEIMDCIDEGDMGKAALLCEEAGCTFEEAEQMVGSQEDEL